MAGMCRFNKNESHAGFSRLDSFHFVNLPQKLTITTTNNIKHEKLHQINYKIKHLL